MDADGLKELECMICLSYPLDAKLISCCEHLVCGNECAPSLGNSCPHCRNTRFSLSPVSGPIKRIINDLSIPCPNECGSNIKIGNHGDHQKFCAKKFMACRFCNQSFPANTFMRHLETEHSRAVMDSCTIGSEEISQPLLVRIDALPHIKNRFPCHKNGTIHTSLGTTGKFYCGKKLDFRCGCCNGNCGPTNGCNCTSCQALDIQFRKLSSGYYVNSAGVVSFRDRQSETFCCMRKERGDICNGTGFVCENCKGLMVAWRSSQAFMRINPPSN